ncbi:MAG: hypothetical protein Q9186_007017 [Xanthomendoza sp. 1 TL-2023]
MSEHGRSSGKGTKSGLILDAEQTVWIAWMAERNSGTWHMVKYQLTLAGSTPLIPMIQIASMIPHTQIENKTDVRARHESSITGFVSEAIEEDERKS